VEKKVKASTTPIVVRNKLTLVNIWRLEGLWLVRKKISWEKIVQFVGG
jgi:hypothetical protein